MKIAIYFDNSKIKGVNCSAPLLGNPGIGGTEYSFLLLIDSLKRYSADTEVFVYLRNDTKLPFNCHKIVVFDVFEALSFSIRDRCDMFLMRNQFDKEIYKMIEKIPQKIITWGQNFYLSDEADLIAKSKNIVLNIFVGRQQYDRYIDHDISKKSIYIYNMVPRLDDTRRINDGRTVVYLGSLVHAKGFHILAKQWSKILKFFPEARLKVIGTGKVYDRDAPLGKAGISDDAYEKKFIRYLTDNQGNLIKSVEFMGLLGAEKRTVLKHSSVGVANPSGRTETFGISIIEMNQFYLPVVTVKKLGFLDTLLNGINGLSFRNSHKIYQGIIKLLGDSELNEELGKRAYAYSSKFIPEKIISDWLLAFESVYRGKKIKFIFPNHFYFYNFKIVRICNRFLRINLHLFFIPSLVQLETAAWKLLRKIRDL